MEVQVSLCIIAMELYPCLRHSPISGQEAVRLNVEQSEGRGERVRREGEVGGRVGSFVEVQFLRIQLLPVGVREEMQPASAHSIMNTEHPCSK